MKRILAILMVAVLLALSFSLVACDGDEEPVESGSSVASVGASYDNPNDGTFGVDFGDLVLPDEEL